MQLISLKFNNSNIRTEQNITVTFNNYVSADWSGGYVEIAPPFGAKVKQTLTSSSVYTFNRESKTLLDNSNKVPNNSDLNPTEPIKKGDFKKGLWIINYKDASGALISQSFLIREPVIKIDYKVDLVNSILRIYDNTNYKMHKSMPTTNTYSVKATAPEVLCSDTNTQGKTYSSPESWNSGSLLYINNRASKSVASTESDEFIVTPIYNATYYIRYESSFTYNFTATDIISSTDSRAVSTALQNPLSFNTLTTGITYNTGPVAMGYPVEVKSPRGSVCEVWGRIKDIDIKYKQALCKNTELAGRLRKILDRALQLYSLAKMAMDIGNTTLAMFYFGQIVDITKTRLT